MTVTSPWEEEEGAWPCHSRRSSSISGGMARVIKPEPPHSGCGTLRLQPGPGVGRGRSGGRLRSGASGSMCLNLASSLPGSTIACLENPWPLVKQWRRALRRHSEESSLPCRVITPPGHACVACVLASAEAVVPTSCPIAAPACAMLLLFHICGASILPVELWCQYLAWTQTRCAVHLVRGAFGAFGAFGASGTG